MIDRPFSVVMDNYTWGDRVWVETYGFGRKEGIVLGWNTDGYVVSIIGNNEQEYREYRADYPASRLSPRDDGPRPGKWRLPEVGDAVTAPATSTTWGEEGRNKTYVIKSVNWDEWRPIQLEGMTQRCSIDEIELVRLHDGPEVTEPDEEPEPTTPEPPVVVADPKADTMHDPVNKPSHYRRGGIEVIDFLEAFLTPDQFEGYLLGTQLAYNSRANWKGSMDEDLRKAEWYQKRLVAFRAKRKES